MADHPIEKLRVTRQEVIGKTKDNRIIYKVFAVHEDGSADDRELRAFAELPIGEVREYGLSFYHHKTYGDTYTLLPAQERIVPRVIKLEERVKALEGQVAQLVGSATPGVSAPGGVNDGDDADIRF